MGMGGGEEWKWVGVAVGVGVWFSALLEAGTWISADAVLRAGVDSRDGRKGSGSAVVVVGFRRVVRGGGAGAGAGEGEGEGEGEGLRRVVRVFLTGSSEVGVGSVVGESLVPERVVRDFVVVAAVGFFVAVVVDFLLVAAGAEGGLTVRIGRGMFVC